MPASLPSGEVWIEIGELPGSKSPGFCHFPQGKCGLKLSPASCPNLPLMSLPSGEVWIEMSITVMLPCTLLSLPSGEVWIEIHE